MKAGNRVDELMRNLNQSDRKPIFFSALYWTKRLTSMEAIRIALKDTGDASERESLKRLDNEIKGIIKYLKPDLMERTALAGGGAILWLGKQLWRNLIVNEPHFPAPSERIPRWLPEGMSRRDRKEKMDSIERVSEIKKILGLSGKIDDQTATRIFYNEPSIKLTDKISNDDQVAKVDLYLDRAEGTGKYYATGFDVATMQGLQLEMDTIAGIDVRNLQTRMAKVSWQTDFSKGSANLGKTQAENKSLLQEVNSIFTNLNLLQAANDPAAKKAFDQLVVNFFLDTPNASLVPQLDEIKRQFEHKVHIDMKATTPFVLSPLETMQVLNDRAVFVNAGDLKRDQNWVTVDFTKKDQAGYFEIRPAAGETPFVLQSALAAAQVIGFPDFRKEKEAIEALQQGGTVKAELLQNGLVVERYIYADPDKGRMAIDWIKSTNDGLFERDDRLAANLEEFVGRQNGMVMGPVVSSSNEAPKEASTPIHQSALWEIDAGEKKSINQANLARLNEQLVQLGVEPRVAQLLATSVLEGMLTTDQREVQRRYNVDYDSGSGDVALRFKRDPEMDWVSFQGHDMKVSFLDGKPDVFQRYYYNPENPLQNYSLSETYWMATGNPVSRIVEDENGKRERWFPLGLDQPKTPQGNHHIVPFDYDLNKGMAEYPRRNEMERSLAPGYTMDGILAKARKGETVPFHIERDGSRELLALQVQPTGGFKIFSPASQSVDLKTSQGPAVKIEKGQDQELNGTEHIRAARALG